MRGMCAADTAGHMRWLMTARCVVEVTAWGRLPCQLPDLSNVPEGCRHDYGVILVLLVVLVDPLNRLYTRVLDTCTSSSHQPCKLDPCQMMTVDIM